MRKYYRIILSLTLVSFVMSQQQSVCNDREYNRLKTKISNNGAESLTEREWEYYKLKDNQCLELKNIEETKKVVPHEWTFMETMGCITIIILINNYVISPAYY
jgi:hypothetical protein